MELTLGRFDPACHSAEAVARLIYQADPSLMRLAFGDEDDAVPVIVRLVGMEHNDYAGRRVICARCVDETVGVIAGLTGKARRESKKAFGEEWARALGVRGMFRAMRYGPKLERVATAELADDEYYISALTVDERYRGQGVGSRLLAEVVRDHDVVVTDVNITKDAAIRFYERHGFAIQQRMTFVHDGEEIGNYQIRREA
jgi:ribosomal protein S18 acetylase RimI-like enzyme